MNIQQQFNALQAMVINTRILSYNRRHCNPLRPLKKCIVGDGHTLALAICGQPQLPQPAELYQPQAPIGAVPPFWDPLIDAYEHLDIINLIIFYNEDFGIVAGDDLANQKAKFRVWLLEGI